LGLAAALSRHGATGSWSVPTLFGAVAGAIALRWLVVTARAAAAAARARRAEAGPRARAPLAPGRLPPIGFDAGRAEGPGAARPGAAGAADAGKAPAAPDEESGAADDDDSLGWVAAGGTPPAGPASGGDDAAGAGTFWDSDSWDSDSWDSDSSDSGARDSGSRAGAREPLRAGPPAARSAGAEFDLSAPRRQFIVAAGVSVAAAAIGEFAGRNLATRKNVSTALQTLKFPRPAVPAPPLPGGVNLPVPGISSYITPNSQFYRVDTAIVLPQVDPSNWTLRIHGMVAREVTVTFDQLLHRPLIEDYITLTCVSDPVGGPYIGNAKWLGASLASLLRAARPLSGANQLLATSADGFTTGTPLNVVLDGRDALVAVAMNGAALPIEHGFPARLVVPGLYGYVSACKWVVDLEVTTFAAAQGYWIPQGWAQQGPIKTESRIDVPSDGTSLQAGQVAVAGVAWAQHKGIEAVEVRVDSGPWHEATLAAVPDIDTWRQWVWQWPATAGTHLIEARATDKTGYTQTSMAENVAPNGASGYPSTQVTVS
jgi:DMSO/TMAO reductase YedYZ molybdopterin-dependent catalytic subunit